MKVYITKYALTQGIFEVEGEVCGGIFGRMFDAEKNGYFHNHPYGIDEWHRTRASAVRTAEQMRQKKIASLEKQIEKLKKMKFE